MTKKDKKKPAMSDSVRVTLLVYLCLIVHSLEKLLLEGHANVQENNISQYASYKSLLYQLTIRQGVPSAINLPEQSDIELFCTQGNKIREATPAGRGGWMINADIRALQAGQGSAPSRALEATPAGRGGWMINANIRACR